jgi:quercetin dioxygenase-like cupin family protein
MKAQLIFFVILMVAIAIAYVARGADPKPETSPKTEAGLPGAMTAFGDVEVLEYDWGWIRWLMNGKLDPNAEMTLGMVFIKPNQTNPAHLHPNSAEYLHVLEGSCEHMVGEKWVTLKKGDTLRIPKDVPHKARTGKQPCRAMIVYNTGDRQFVEVKE